MYAMLNRFRNAPESKLNDSSSGEMNNSTDQGSIDLKQKICGLSRAPSVVICLY